MKTFELEYEIKAEELKQIVALAIEIHSHTKQEPNCIWGEGLDPIPWNHTESVNFVNGKISEKEYLEKSKS